MTKNFYDWTLGKPFLNTTNLSPKNIADHTVTSIIVIILSTGIRLIAQYNRDKIKRIELKEIAKKAELEALKAQINPHFLYNSFNSLYALAKIKSDKTADAILQLSDIMRYVTYKSSQKKVSIFEELDFIQNYIKFQKLRVTNPDLKIISNINFPKVNFMISPLILISFVENAFKHSNLLRSDAMIKIDFKPTENGFRYLVTNVIAINANTDSGVGLKTLNKILDFAYPDKYLLRLYVKNNVHYAELNLNLKK